MFDKKIYVARAQLGAGLYLFIRDKDPISVHSLTCGGCEVKEGYAEHLNLENLSSHILKTYPAMKKVDIKKTENQYWNALKHFYERDNKTARDDEALLQEFSDVINDAYLFKGWYDYLRVVKKLPVEAQVFQVWRYALYEEKIKENEDPVWRSVFPNILSDDRREQKRRLRRMIEKYKKDKIILNDIRTEKALIWR